MITQEMLQNTAVSLSKIFFAMYYCDLRKQTYETLDATEYSRQMLDGIQTLPEAFERFIQILVKSEDAQVIREFCNLATLAERLENAPYISCDYDSRLGDGWRQVGFIPVEYDENQKVSHVLFVVRSLDERRSRKKEEERKIQQLVEMQQRAAQLVSSSEIVAVALIDKNSGATRLSTNYCEIENDKEYNLEECVRMEEAFVAPIDQPMFKKEFSLDNLSAKLRQNKHYTFAASLIGREERYFYVIHHFAEMDDGRYILLVVEDATKRVSVDVVTGCINRVGFSKRSQIFIEAANSATYSVMCFDVKDFKAINNWYGFDNGDKVLKEIAGWIQASALNPILTCRENADIFFCLVERENIRIQEIERLCHTRYCLDNLQVPVTLRCGIYHVYDQKEDIHSICDKARLACFHCENLPDLNYCFFVDRLEENYLDQAYILQNYNTAIANGQIEVFFQPIFDAKTKTIVSAEALVRWRHPEHGILSPGIFIPTLEQNGYIAELDRYVGESVWKMLEQRIREKKSVVPIALNMSRYDFRRKQSMDDIETLVRSVPDITKYIRLEITESSFSDISKDGKKFINSLRQMGAKILVDDFGAGYSSLGMLTEFECDVIKLDMSFARSIENNPKAEILVSSAIQVIHKLGVQVVAEGVETKEQYKFFCENGCDFIQGYYFSKPVSGSEFERLLDEGQSVCI